MSGFPINLDLSEYFDDLRKYSSIFVNLSKFKEVRDVENHVKSVFGLEDNICFIHRKFLIPKSEDIQILQQYEIFKVQKCNFYDLQIHKTKKANTNSPCDLNALNLTQVEKTIDLSCRPKQRLKANICPSPSVSRSLSLNIDSQAISPERALLLNGNHNVSKEKPKSKKKKYVCSDESDDDVGNILDMSVNNSKRKTHSNCFSTDDGSLLSDGVHDIYHGVVSKNVHKKAKKRKKNVEDVDDVNLATTCWNNSTFDDVAAKDQNIKKKSKRSVENGINDTSCSNTDLIKDDNEIEYTIIDYDSKHSIDGECPTRKKHKHINTKHNRNGDSKSHSEENQYYLNNPSCTSTSKQHKKTSISKTFCDSNQYETDSRQNSETLEEYKKNMKKEIDKMMNDLQKKPINPKGPNIQNDRPSEKPIVVPKEQSLPVSNNLQENDKESYLMEDLTQESTNTTQSWPACPEKKRKRKHNKKKKRERLLYMSAVGPALSQLKAQPTVTESSPTSEISKHVFFTEDDFVEDMSLPSTPPGCSQPTKNQDGLKVEASSQDQMLPKPETWQNQLLQLASSSSKPVVFQRNTSVATTNKQIVSPQPVHCTPGSNSIQTTENTRDSERHQTDNNKYQEDAQRPTNENQNTVSDIVDSCNSRKGLPDICFKQPLPIPNDLQNINLSDYPIIGKVVPDDLILFKVLKLNESGEPGISKPILAKVNGTSKFPVKISLQIMEGCEECSHCAQAEPEESGEAFTVELQWSDILEPRLFYP